MQYTDEEISKLKAMLLFLVKKKHNESDGHCGFHINELEPVLKQLEEDGEVETRPTINTRMYFLKNGTLFHNDQNDQQ
ncbi:hypothetical protein [Mesonia aestuariivivens]|uniref:ArsR family transcriptional regulator n=1 Tax=Mesonia aestuariivivens TaxID=2796128 RepID=A0ABS6W0L2_9FLAO|nr:hypothetical protein [Mesonia aestuariivivens]MBW2961294.1 hypothetical protein [Mesonia aestuariivivens]